MKSCRYVGPSGLAYQSNSSYCLILKAHRQLGNLNHMHLNTSQVKFSPNQLGSEGPIFDIGIDYFLYIQVYNMEAV